jgi:aspartate-semialdehyde dehydrogenase
MKKYTVAVVGATGAVGRTMLEVLAERNLPLGRVRAMASVRSAGTRILWKGEPLQVEDVARADFGGVDLALFAGGEVASAEYAPRACAQGALVIDNSATFRMDPKVPLVVPEVNPHHLAGHSGLIANPNCSTIQMVVALAPIHAAAGLKRVAVATYQSVSGTGKEALEELQEQTRSCLDGGPLPSPRVYPRRIAFNVLPQIAAFDEEGSTGEEVKMAQETRKILGLADLPVMATCVRVPVLHVHSEVVYVETERSLSPEQAREVLRCAPGIRVVDDPARGEYPTPLDAEGQDLVLVGRIRRDPTVPHGLAMWVVADNLRKGAATNAVQIAEVILEVDGKA